LGDANTATDAYALYSPTTGFHNIAVGVAAGGALTSGSDNIYLGNSGGTATESNTMRLGGVQTQTFIAGIGGVPVSGSAVLVSNTGQLGIQASSSRYKRDIQPMGAHSRGLLQLRPVIFRYKHDAQGERQYGLIAEEVVKVYPELVTRGATGDVEAVRYHEVIPMLLNEMQHQQRQLAAQAQELAALKAQNARLRAAVVQQQERDAALAARLERLEAAAAHAATLASR
jgi:Chaperone of endosialidase